MKTLLVRRGNCLSIRALGTARADGVRDDCPTLAFFEEQRQERFADLTALCALLTRIAEGGPPHNELRFKKLAGWPGLYECKAGALRLICFWEDANLIICTHGYVKASQKAPKQELQRAQDLMKAYFRDKFRGGKHGKPQGN